jgi:hypothetical protein
MLEHVAHCFERDVTPFSSYVNILYREEERGESLSENVSKIYVRSWII